MTLLVDPSRLETFGCRGGDYTLYDEQNGIQYATHYFTTVGTSTFQVIHGAGEVQTLVVAGGGGGGMDMGGGGGGGGVVFNPTVTLSHGQTITVTVGNGGTGAPAAGTSGQNTGHQYNISATNGGNSAFGAVTATGGGRGGSSFFGYTPDYGYGAVGGSGGGASGYSDGNTGRGAAGTVGQGYSGGNAGGQYYSGGGGGAAGSGASGTAQANGGPGIQHPSISTFYWGGGGGGAAYSLGTGGNGGIGGGGGGAIGTTTGGAGINNGSGGGGGSPGMWANTPGGNAGANTGGGGGGGAHYNANNKGGDGGSGIVLVRYPIKSTSFTTTGLGLHYDLTNSSSYPGSGTTIFDLSGNGLNATGSSVITNQALQANQPYSTATTSLLNTDTHTICFSIQINNTRGDWDKVFEYAPAGTDRSPGVWRYPNDRLFHWRYDSSNSGVDFGPTTTWPTGFTINTWYYCCVVKNGGTAEAYVNGVRVNTASVTNPKFAGTAPIRLYSSFLQNSSLMRHVHVYNRSLTSHEIIANWRAIKSSIGY